MTKPPCRHETLLARIKIPVNEYVCDDCKGKLVLVLSGGLMTPEAFEQFKRVQAMQIKAAERQKKTGLVTPDEHRQAVAQQKQKEGKR